MADLADYMYLSALVYDATYKYGIPDGWDDWEQVNWTEDLESSGFSAGAYYNACAIDKNHDVFHCRGCQMSGRDRLYSRPGHLVFFRRRALEAHGV